jgi:anaerobic sulfatase-maturating enzyme
MSIYAPFAKPLYVMLKPVGSLCNLACDYCYYLEKSKFYTQNKNHVMSDELLERFTQEYLESQTMPQVLFTWHGGEPLMRPLSFYKKALELQKKYGRGRQIDNSIQTNGTLLTDEWCAFFKENNFLVGISIDGPQEFHDEYRRDKMNRPTFQKVMRGIELLQKHEVDFNCMAVVNDFNADYPLEFYRFFKEIGCQFLQFTPIVERMTNGQPHPTLATVAEKNAELAPFSVSPQQWGNFLCAVFDEWVKKDVGKIFVQIFDSTLCRRIVEPVHRQLRKMAEAEYAEYQCALAEYALDKHKSEADKPMEPPLRLLFIPANTSATGMLQLLNDNAGRGLMFETEGDTLAQAFKQEYGNYSDSFRKAFHHETIAYNRRKDREYVEIKKPCLSAVLSGTPKQIKHLIPDVENGLFSRFLFYNLEISPVWKNVFAEDEDETLDDYFEQIGERFYDLYRLLERETDSLRFCFTRNQEKQFSEFFDRMHKKYYTLYGGEFVSSIRRLGLMTFRMAMIMTTLRIMDDGDLKTLLVCSDTDFQTVIRMAEVIVQHTREVYLEFFSSDAASDADDAEAGGRWKQPVISRVYFENLPFEFNRQTYLATASRMNIKPKTAEKYIRNFCKLHRLVHTGYDNYRKAAVTLRR